MTTTISRGRLSELLDELDVLGHSRDHWRHQAERQYAAAQSAGRIRDSIEEQRDALRDGVEALRDEQDPNTDTGRHMRARLDALLS